MHQRPRGSPDQVGIPSSLKQWFSIATTCVDARPMIRLCLSNTYSSPHAIIARRLLVHLFSCIARAAILARKRARLLARFSSGPYNLTTQQHPFAPSCPPACHIQAASSVHSLGRLEVQERGRSPPSAQTPHTNRRRASCRVGSGRLAQGHHHTHMAMLNPSIRLVISLPGQSAYC